MAPSRWTQVVDVYKSLSPGVKACFDGLDTLIRDYIWEVSTGFVFSQIEYYNRLTLYCGLLKIHGVNKDLAWKAIENSEITNSNYPSFFNKVFIKNLDKNIFIKYITAYKIRNKVVHGSIAREKDHREAITLALNYSEEFNNYVHKIAGVKPFGRLTGFSGRKAKYSPDTTRWILKGMDFNLS